MAIQLEGRQRLNGSAVSHFIMFSEKIYSILLSHWFRYYVEINLSIRHFCFDMHVQIATTMMGWLHMEQGLGLSLPTCSKRLVHQNLHM